MVGTKPQPVFGVSARAEGRVMVGQVRRRGSTWARALIALPTMTVVAGCSMLPGAGPNPAAAAAAPATTSATQCADLDGQAALDRWAFEVPDADLYDLAAADTSEYDPCAPLSWIWVPETLSNRMSTVQVMLFHQGQFVRMADPEGFYFHPTITRVAPNAMRVEFDWYPRPNAEQMRVAVQTFTWDDTAKSVTVSGTSPTIDDVIASDPRADMNLPPEQRYVPGPEPKVQIGGRRPADAIPIRTVKDQWGNESGVIVTPSGNLRCEFEKNGGWASCGADSYYETRKYGTSEDGEPNWWIVFYGDGPDTPQPHWDKEGLDRKPAQMIEYGELAYFEEYVCLSEQRGLSCWNENTGDGLFLNREGYEHL